MAMEKQYTMREIHTRALTAVGFNPVRREIMVGCEDGLIKAYEAESGKLLATLCEHKGWVTDFLYWPEGKLILSSGNDGQLLAWGAGCCVLDRIHMPLPIYCLALNSRRHQLICGVNSEIRGYALDEDRECGHVINSTILFATKEHTDIVLRIVCLDSRIYSVGYDQKLVIYDSNYTGNNRMTPVFSNQVHDAGITCLVAAKDNDNNTCIITGSFDKTVKIWTVDGKLVHKLDGFSASVTGVCYIPRNKTIWVAAGTAYAMMYDPRSGENISDFSGTFQNTGEEKYQLQILEYSSALNQIVATTSRRQVTVWRYNTQGCVTALKTTVANECLCFTAKEPILIFSGDHEGVITKWERMQSNHFMYSKETIQTRDLKKKKKVGTRASLELEKQETSKLPNRAREQKTRRGNYAFSPNQIPSLTSYSHPNTTIMRMLYIESLDCLLAASEDTNIYVWGFDDSAMEVLQELQPDRVDQLVQKYGVLLDSRSLLLPQNAVVKTSDSVTNRVAGFVCKCVLIEHQNCVTSLLLVGREHGQDSTYVLSAGWDKRICLWDLETCELKDTLRMTRRSQGDRELASDGIITDMAYNPKTNEFAYSSSDKMVYLRKFDTRGSHMFLTNTLQGHEGEVTCVVWNDVCDKWVTASEDGTLRIWSAAAMNECEQVLAVNNPITCMCVDYKSGCVVVGTQTEVRVYDPETYRLLQTNRGHTDSVRSVMYIHERDQYVSCSWDTTVRTWNAYKKPSRKKGEEDGVSSLKSKGSSGTMTALDVHGDVSVEPLGGTSAGKGPMDPAVMADGVMEEE